ncbi:MAG: HNH endonuclease [Ruminococcus sp.]|nr:HNH endonuclease [Ruminococcus sp.]
MLLKNCPRCKTLIPYGKPYCPKCTAIVEQEREEQKQESARRYNARRDPKYTKFYRSKPWKLLSAKRLSVDKFCAFCGKPAVEVDHIIEIQTPEGWARRLDWNNTRSLCHKCHDKRHNRFQGKKKRQG